MLNEKTCHWQFVVLLSLCLSAQSGESSRTDRDTATDNPRRLQVAVAQPLVIPGDVAENIRNLKPLVTNAAKQGAELVVFSECALTGFDLKGVGVKAALASGLISASSLETCLQLNLAMIACNRSVLPSA